jgi:hypothetical protein
MPNHSATKLANVLITKRETIAHRKAHAAEIPGAAIRGFLGPAPPKQALPQRLLQRNCSPPSSRTECQQLTHIASRPLAYSTNSTRPHVTTRHTSHVIAIHRPDAKPATARGNHQQKPLASPSRFRSRLCACGCHATNKSYRSKSKPLQDCREMMNENAALRHCDEPSLKKSKADASASRRTTAGNLPDPAPGARSSSESRAACLP